MDRSDTEHRWIVGVDGSPTSRHALQWALAHTARRNVTVTAIQCWEPLEGWPDHPRPDEELRTVQDQLEGLRSDLGPAGSELEVVAAYGNPTSVMLDHAEKAGLLVLGTRGMGGFQRLLLGSVSLQTVTHSPIPVAVIAPTARLDGVLDRIVVGVDGSANSHAALVWALSFATEKTTTVAVGAWEPSVLATRADAVHFDELSASWRDAFHQTVGEASRTASPAVEVTRSFEYAKPADALIQHAAGADLLVVGARGRGAIASAILGSVTNTVLHQAPCPIVVVPRS